MKILSGIIAPFLMIATAALLFHARAEGAGKKKCDATDQLRFGLTGEGCDDPEHALHSTGDFKKWLKDHGIGSECYKIHTWKNYQKIGDDGDLDVVNVQCNKPKQRVGVLQQTGSNQTQRIMFSSAKTKAAFGKQFNAAKQ